MRTTSLPGGVHNAPKDFKRSIVIATDSNPLWKNVVCVLVYSLLEKLIQTISFLSLF